MNRRTTVSRILGWSLAAAAVVAIGLPAIPDARAGGFLIYDLSGEATGKASAVIAVPSDPTAVWYNPAGLSFQPGIGLSVGTLAVTVQTRFEPQTGGAGAATSPDWFFVPYLFAAAETTPWMHVGMGVCSTWGLGSRYPADWSGHNSYIKGAMASLMLNPTFAFRLHDRVSLGVGLQVVRATMDVTNGVPALGTARVGTAGWGYGANAGLLFKAIPGRLNVGVTYRSRVKLPLEGRADFTVPPEYVRDLPDQAARTEVTLPDIIGVGLLWRPIPSVDLTLDGQVVLWNVYDETVVSLQAQPSPVVSRHDYKVSGTVRLGAEWRPPVEGLAVRAGFIWDQSPAPSGVVDPSLPDAEQLDGTVGIGYRWRWIQADLGYQLAGFLPKEDTSGTIGPRGTYSTMGHFLVATLTFRLDPRAPKVAPQPDL